MADSTPPDTRRPVEAAATQRYVDDAIAAAVVSIKNHLDEGFATVAAELQSSRRVLEAVEAELSSERDARRRGMQIMKRGIRSIDSRLNNHISDGNGNGNGSRG